MDKKKAGNITSRGNSRTQACAGKGRIDGWADHATSKVDELLTNYTKPRDLTVGLEQIRNDLRNIAMDHHKAQ